MKTNIIYAIIGLIFILIIAAIFKSKVNGDMIITSPAFNNNTSIPKEYTCDGKNINPELIFSNIPSGAKSLTLIMYDPDAPSGIFVHWVIYNINPSIKQIKRNTGKVDGLLGINSIGKTSYMGPCPPSGTHRYFFKLYAIDTVFEPMASPDKRTIEEKMQGHVVQQAEIIGLYSRQ